MGPRPRCHIGAPQHTLYLSDIRDFRHINKWLVDIHRLIARAWTDALKGVDVLRELQIRPHFTVILAHRRHGTWAGAL